jgi:hypothetical protein
MINLNESAIDLTAPSTSIGTTTPVAVTSTIFTALPANNTSAFVASGSSLIGSNAQNLVNLSQTWNTTGTPTAIFANITDTASNAASNLMDLRVGGVSRLSVRKDGQIMYSSTLGLGFFDANTLEINNGTIATTRDLRARIGLFASGPNEIWLEPVFRGIVISSSRYMAWASGQATLSSSDIRLHRDTTGTLAQRESAITQVYRLYKSYTDASNYTRAAWQFNSNGIVLAGESAGIGDANIGFSFGIKGTGAFQLQPTDNTITGGNARGAYAIDLQSLRNNPAQVASGANSFAAGAYATASGASSIAISQATATGQFAIAMGSGCVAVGNGSGAFGSSVVALGNQAFGFGLNLTVNGEASFAVGNRGTTKGVASLMSIATNLVNVPGATQTTITTLGGNTTDATPTVLKSNTVVTNATNQLALLNNSSIAFTAIVTASTTAAGNCSSWEFKGQIQRDASAASTTLVAAITPVLIAQKAGASTWAVAVTADTTNGCLAVIVTGQVATTIRWTCTIFASEVAF